MDLRTWVVNEGRGARSKLQRETGLSFPTIDNAIAGGALKQETVDLLHRATRGEVTFIVLPSEAADVA